MSNFASSAHFLFYVSSKIFAWALKVLRYSCFASTDFKEFWANLLPIYSQHYPKLTNELLSRIYFKKLSSKCLQLFWALISL